MEWTDHQMGLCIKDDKNLQLIRSIGGLKINDIPSIFENNEGCNVLSTHPVHHQRTKHIDIKRHFVGSHVLSIN